MKNKKPKSPQLPDRAAFEAQVDRIAQLSTELRAVEAQRDHAIQEVQLESADHIAELQREIKAKAEQCAAYADAHRAELLQGKAKSAETPLARYGYRIGNKTVQLLKKSVGWDKVIKLLKGAKAHEAVRKVEEVDKDFIIRNALTYDRAPTILYHRAGDVDLALLGLKLSQKESFFIEPKVGGAS